MQTQKLYYEDCHLRRFTAVVLRCEKGEKGYRVLLDRTAFYPESGGQASDTGTLDGVRVLHAHEEGETVIHLCDAPLEAGSTVEGSIDWDRRFDLMQQHSGEHMVSGIIHERYGAHNTGFHMGADCITIDFDTEIPAGDLSAIEAQVNAAVWRDLPLRCFWPSPEELPGVVYRTKKALPWPVRIVQIPGVDSCACCGVHVASTGEIGLVKLLSCVRFRGGSRIELLCGKRAFDYLNAVWQQNALVSRAFSAKPTETGAAAQKVNELIAQQKYRVAGLENQVFETIARGCEGKENVLLFQPGLDSQLVRRLADLAAERVSGTAAVFSGEDGRGYAYALVSRSADLKELCQAMNRALSGRGGGKDGFCQGSVRAGKKRIGDFFGDRGW